MTIVNFDWDENEDNIVEEYNDAGVTVAEYTTEPGLYGNVVSQWREEQSSYFHYDAQGSSLALTNSSGDVTDTNAYSAFGEIALQTGSTVTPFRYIARKGYYLDTELGQYDVRRRPFLARSGRWLSTDPIELGMASNVYLYVGNSALMAVDPSGTTPTCGADPTRENCCCCMTDHFALLDRPLFREENNVGFWGHHLWFVARIEYVLGKGQGKGCRLEWWKCANVEGSLGQKPNQWNRIDTLKDFKDANTNLHDYYNGSIHVSCPGDLTLFVKDDTEIPYPGARVTKFAVRLVSEKGCVCDFDEFWDFFTEVLEVKEGRSLTH